MENDRTSQPSAPADAGRDVSDAADAATTSPVQHHHRERDFGVGYGNSSGYGRSEHFVRVPAAPIFRCS